MVHAAFVRANGVTMRIRKTALGSAFARAQALRKSAGSRRDMRGHDIIGKVRSWRKPDLGSDGIVVVCLAGERTAKLPAAWPALKH